MVKVSRSHTDPLAGRVHVDPTVGDDNDQPLLQLVDELVGRGVTLSVVEGELRVRAPQGVLDERLRHELRRRKPALVGLLLDRGAESPGASDGVIQPREPGESPPLSFAQERMWFIQHHDGQDPRYNVPFGVRLRGSLVPSALRAAIGDVVARHEPLRSRFPTDDGAPSVQLLAAERFVVATVDLRPVEPDAREFVLDRILHDDGVRTVDLGEGPVFRALLIRIDVDDHALVLNGHHIASDGWSTTVLARELALSYRFRIGEGAPLPRLTIGYGDFAHWQRTLLADGGLARQIDYWRDQLANAPATDELPWDHPVAQREYRGHTVTVHVPSSTADAFEAVGRRRSATSFMTYLAAYASVLASWKGERAVSIGTPVAGRHHRDTGGLIGMFANTLVMHVPMEPHDPFSEVLERTRGTTVDALANQDAPFEHVLAELKLGRVPHLNPLFESTFSLRERSGPGSDSTSLPGLVAAPIGTDLEQIRFGIEVTGVRGEDGLIVGFAYDRSLFDEASITIIAARFQRLLEEVAAGEDPRVDEVRRPTVGQLHALRYEWNHPPNPSLGRELPLSQLLDRAAEHPDRVAVDDDGHVLSYGALARATHAMAQRLTAAGVQRGDIVAVPLRRGIDLVVALLGIAGARAVSLPLDPRWPTARQRALMADAGARVVLVDPDGHHDREAHAHWREAPDIVVLAATRPRLADAPLRAPNTEPTELISILYTSGSTGAPKGIGLTHGSIPTMFADDPFGFSDGPRIALASNPAFDAFQLELWGALLHGGCCVIVDNATVTDPAQLMRFTRAAGVQAMFTTSSLVEPLSRVAGSAWSHLRTLLYGGDIAPVAALYRLHNGDGPGRSVNIYGPTENTVFATTHSLVAAPSLTRALPIGRPVTGRQTYLGDGLGQPCSRATTAELYLGGPGLARGYHRRPRLTAKKFVPDGISGAHGARLYRTGDRGRIDSRGRFSFVGRVDHQVKIRGHRIELEEIESVLRRWGAREAACVVDRGAEPSDARIVAHLVAGSAGEAAVDELRRALRQQLPEYMVPNAVVWHAGLPLTTSGKLDRKALQKLSPDDRSLSSRHRPRDTAHEAIAMIWEGSLRVTGIDGDSDFFDLGGHSMVAARMVAEISKTFDVDVGVRTLFEHSSFDAFCVAVQELRDRATGRRRPPLVAHPELSVGPLSFAQERLWLFEQVQGRSLTYHMPAAFRVADEITGPAILRALRALVGRHTTLRTRFHQRGDEWVQASDASFAPEQLWIAESDACPLRGERLGDAEIAEAIDEFLRRPFDLVAQGGFRALVVHEPTGHFTLVFDMHHIVSDGWSMSVLVADFLELVDAELRGRAPELPPLPVSYLDFARWQRQCLDERRRAELLSFWQDALRDAPAEVTLPLDRSRPAEPTFEAGRASFTLGPEVVVGLREWGRRESTSLFVVALAAFQLAVARFTMQRDIVVGTVASGREHPDLERLVGFFVNTLVVRVELDPQASFRALLRRVRATWLKVLDHQDLPFEQLVAALGPNQQLNLSPLFQLMFTLNEGSAADTEAGDDRLRPLATGLFASKYDLELALTADRDQLRATAVFDGSLFDQATIDAFVATFRTVLTQLGTSRADDPGPPVGTLPVATAGAQERWARGPVTPTFDRWRDVDLFTLFEAQVERTPYAIAVREGDTELSYQALRRRARAVADGLARSGAGPGKTVALRLPRGIELTVGLLATLATGAAYLPVETDGPLARHLRLLADAKAQVAIGPPGELRSEANERSMQDVLDPATAVYTHSERVGGQATAYIMYTSGSTGTPKGIRVSHRAVAALIAGATWVDLDRRLRFGHISNPAFDASTFELWGSLLSGGTLVTIDGPDLLDAPVFEAVLGRHRIEAMFVTAALFAQTVEHRPRAFASVRHLIVGGDVVPPHSAERLLRETPSVQLANGYGPTETTTFAAVGPIDQVEARQRIPLGRPIPQRETWVLDSALGAQPPGALGEICIAGPGLATGYVARPRLTAERFVPHPFPVAPGERLYRSGDRGRWRSDGRLDFWGRNDGQLKLRGFRVETREIETELVDAGCRTAAVIAVDSPHGKRLQAFVVADDDVMRGLPAEIRRRLASYMVPAEFISLPALPMTRNGKVDVTALVRIGTEPKSSPASTFASTNVVTQLVVGAWSAVLGCEVCPDDDFFDLGGHSLSATRISARLRESLGADVSVRQLFETPRLRDFVRAIEPRIGGTDVSDLPPLQPRPMGSPTPLSVAQQRLWVLDRLTAAPAAYNMPFSLGLRGELDRPALKNALRTIVERHEVLRTSFPLDGVAPGQRLHDPAGFVATEIDLSELEAPQSVLDAIHQRDASRAFDLQARPAIRVTIVRRGDQDHVLLLDIHHIAFDGWSVSILTRELDHLYRANISGTEVELPPLELQYGDYAVWQRRALDRELGAELIQRSVARLRGAPTTHGLMLDRPRPTAALGRGASTGRQLDPALAARLELRSAEWGVTPFMVFLAAYGAALHTAGAGPDILVGTPIAGREDPRLEDVIGFFVDTAVLRLRHDPTQTALDSVLAVRNEALAAHEDRELPFERLVKALEVSPDRSRHPVFQIMFSVDNTPAARLQMPGIAFEAAATPETPVKFDLDLAVSPYEDGYQACLRYDADLFEPETANRLLQMFENAVATILEHPEHALDAARLLPPTVRDAVERKWTTGPVCASPSHENLAQAFEAQCQRTPDRVALVCEQIQLTYGFLDRASLGLAHRMADRGVAAESLVTLELDRSIEFVIAMLATVRAGAAYVPLPPSTPEQRRATILETVRPTCRVVASGLALDRTQIEVDAVDSGRSVLPSLGLRVHPEQLAYVLHTSGSTGVPKGVSVSHACVLQHIARLDARFPRRANSVQLLRTSPDFDVSVVELWPGLTSGDRVVVSPGGPRPDLRRLARTLDTHRVTTLNAVPAVASAVLEQPPARFTSVQWLFCGGDVLRRETLETLAQRAPGATIVNRYGPTECTVSATGWQHDAETPARIPIGTPHPGTSTFVVDGSLRAVAPGTRGELALGGWGVSRGYLHAPRQTAARFVPDPFGPPGSRLYLTGDHAAWRSHGDLLFLGRSDHQVKVRGQRIELGEIAAALRSEEGVADAVVKAFVDADGRQQLVAYLEVTHPQQVLEHLDIGLPRSQAEQIDAALLEHVPQYMVPDAYVLTERLPRTPAGKVDVQALHAPQSEPPSDGHADLPQTPTEEIVAEIWSEVLERDDVRRSTNFFALDGDSLRATQVIARAQSVFTDELSPADLFDHPRLADFARQVDELMRRGHGSQLPPMEPRVRPPRPPLSFAQQRLWFIQELEGPSALYNMPFPMVLGAKLSARALTRALRALVARHEALRTRFPERDGVAWQDVVEPDGFHVAWVDAADGPGDALEHSLLRQESLRPFDLREGPVLRATVFRLANERHLLLLNIHHIACDGWSMEVLMNEVRQLYRAHEAREPADLDPLPLQYIDYALWQRAWLEQAGAKGQLEYWLDTLRSSPERSTLEPDRHRPPRPSHRGRSVDFSTPKSTLEGLRALGRSQDASLFMVLLAAFASVLEVFCGRDDVLIGTPTAGRNHKSLDPLIGFFVNTLVLRLRGRPALSGAERIKLARRTVLDALANQDAPFERLVSELANGRNTRHHPLFQVMFSLEHAPDQRVDEEQLYLPTAGPELGLSKFDLSVGIAASAHGLVARLTYAADLYHDTTMRHVARAFEAALEQLVNAPGDPPRPQAWMDAAARHQMLVEWQPPALAGTHSETITSVFERRRHEHGDCIAIVSDDRHLSYETVGRAVEGLALRLVRAGIGPEDRVGINIDRGPERVVAMLATSRVGAAFVPLSSTDPPARHRRILALAGARLVLVDDAAAVPEGISSLRVSGEALRPRAETAVIPHAPRPSNLVYAMPTSGTTGTPKLVGIPHHALLCHLETMAQQYPSSVRGVVLQHTPPTFDVAMWETFGPLLHGGRLVLAAPGLRRDPPQFIGAMRRHQVTTLQVVPSLLAALLRAGHWPHPSFERIFCGGEALDPELAAAAANAFGQADLHNLYGPTEATIDASGWCYRPERSRVAIGRPHPGTDAFVLDPQLRALPRGAVGELFVGGERLARGYVGAPRATAARFVPHPFSDGARLYRTGDLVRWGHDGRLEFVNRNDRQFKLRGQRIELGEVDAALRSHPAVDDAVAAVVDDSHGAAVRALVQAHPRYTKTVRGLTRNAVAPFLRVAHPSISEAHSEFDLLFGSRTGLGGLTLADGDWVVDVGAGAGLFSLYAAMACPGARVLAIEPDPGIRPSLEVNLRCYASTHRVYDGAIGSTDTRATFETQERTALFSGLRDFDRVDDEAYLEFREQVLSAPPTEIEIPQARLSTLLGREGVAKIGLLRIDVARDTLAILRTLDARDLSDTRQISAEVLGVEHVEACESLLSTAGMQVTIEETDGVGELRLFQLIAIREDPGVGREQDLELWEPELVDEEDLDEPTVVEHVRSHLSASMCPSRVALVDELPRLVNGKLDHLAIGKLLRHLGEASTAPPCGDLEIALSELWGQVLDLRPRDRGLDFFEAGGHSLLATQLAARTSDAFGVQFAVADVFERPTLQQQALRLAELLGSDTIPPARETTEEATRWALPTRQPAPLASVAPAFTLFTGATGQVGAARLTERLRTTHGKVRCLVRATTPSLALQRIRQAVAQHGTWSPEFDPRVEVICGNLAKPRLGLTRAEFDDLVPGLQHIVHRGAIGHSTCPYPIVRLTNVLGTREILRLAARAGVSADVSLPGAPDASEPSTLDRAAASARELCKDAQRDGVDCRFATPDES